jgi:aspartate racemase
MVAEALQQAVAIPVIDSNAVYARHCAAWQPAPVPQPFRLGVIGGVGPAATVDFLDKVVRHTDAARDQDHIRVVMDHNPQIPDRTANLIGDGRDPSIALLAACLRLEAQHANLIAIPCNSAHAYVARIQPHLGIPIVNMLDEAAQYVRRTWPQLDTVGLLATDGTIETGIYRDAMAAAGLRIVVPDPAHQRRVMQAIYGVKAGANHDACVAHLRAAIAHLAHQGVRVILLGCTELPLLLPGGQLDEVASVTLIDPTDVLARRCVALAKA